MSLEVRGLSVRFANGLQAVDGLDLNVGPSETVGVVGESGSGKSVSALAVLGLLGREASVSGSVRWRGHELLGAKESTLRALRGRELAMVFQDPAVSLNPRHRVGTQVAEPLRLHQGLSKPEAWTQAVRLLHAMGVPAPEVRANAWPHELSGGLQQRVMIAQALACEPGLLIADEPTTALDVTVQAQVLALLAKVQRERQMAMVLVSHDLGLVAESCTSLVVLYAGQVVERGPTAEVLTQPRHPYTRGLLDSTPTLEGQGRFHEIPGTVPDLRTPPPGCRFADRCPRVRPECRAVPIAWSGDLAQGVRCLYPLEPSDG